VFVGIILLYLGILQFRKAYLFQKDPDRLTDGLHKMRQYEMAVCYIFLSILILLNKIYVADFITYLMKKIGF
ncbi:MAG: hypothetical protein RL757_94, partial [Bacteroidota bacterium]